MTQPTFRPFNPEQDLTSYVACLNSIAASKGEPQAFTEVAQREQAEMLDEAGIITNRFVAEAQGAIVGFVDIWKILKTSHAPLTMGIQPEWQGQGVEQELVKDAAKVARGLGATSLLAYVQPNDNDARAFFTTSDFISVSGYRKMSTELMETPAQPRWAEGFSVSTYARVEEPHVHTEACNKGWSDLWGHQVATEKTTAATLKAYPPEGIFLLFSGDEVVGICKARELEASGNGDAPTADVDAPGIAPDYRSEVNYRNMLLEALHWLYQKGHRRVVLESWGELDIALAAYKGLGFRLDEHELGYALSLQITSVIK